MSPRGAPSSKRTKLKGKGELQRATICPSSRNAEVPRDGPPCTRSRKGPPKPEPFPKNTDDVKNAGRSGCSFLKLITNEVWGELF